MAREVQITFDCAHPAAPAAIRDGALGGQAQPPSAGSDSWGAAPAAFGMPRKQWNSRSAGLPLEGPYPRISFQRVPEVIEFCLD